MSEAHSCKYCNNEYYWHRLLNHYMREHKNEFLTDKDHKFTLQTFYKRKEGVSKAVVQKDGTPVWCCFGCMKLFSREHFKDEHLRKSKSCKDKHMAFEEENKMLFLDTKTAEQVVSGTDSEALLKKIKALEQQNAKLMKDNETLKERLRLSDECLDEETEKRMLFQDVIDEEIPETQRVIIKRIMSRRNPKMFKEMYDEFQCEVSVSDEEADEEQSVGNVEEEQEKEEAPFVPPRNIIVSAKRIEPLKPIEPPKSIEPPTLPVSYSQEDIEPAPLPPPKPIRYSIYHHNDEVLFKDDNNILYDKSYRGEYIRCGFINSSGKVIFD